MKRLSKWHIVVDADKSYYVAMWLLNDYDFKDYLEPDIITGSIGLCTSEVAHIQFNYIGTTIEDSEVVRPQLIWRLDHRVKNSKESISTINF